MMFSFVKLLAVPLAIQVALAAPSGKQASVVNTTTCNGQTYEYQELAGYGYLPASGRDKFGDTLGGIGSSIAFDSNSWRKIGKSYRGLLYCLPDRGWNTQGTLNYQNRVHKIEVTLTPEEQASVSHPSKPNIHLQYLDTILFTDPSGRPTSGLDANIRGPYLTFPEIPFELPSVNYTGNGFGGKGPGGHRVVVDSEGLFLANDGSFWVSDEYGPYVYHFNPAGRMIGAIRPPNAFIPLRNGSESFSADSPPIYDQSLEPIPEDNPTGRANNHGLEGLTTNPSRTKLYALLQAALNQDGALAHHADANTRFLIYDITKKQPSLEAEYVVHLPMYTPIDDPDDPDVAAQSEIHYISETQFLVLARDKDVGRGQDETQSVYRHADVFDISEATNVMGTADCYTCQVASKKGKLHSDITPAEYCQWLDFNVNAQLKRFGVHNGGAQDKGLLNEKWESLALVPVEPGSYGSEEYYLFSFSDNDFITQDGYMNFGRFHYKDDSGYNLLNQALAFKVKLPKGSQPLLG